MIGRSLFGASALATIIAAAMAGPALASSAYQPGYSANWWAQIGLTSAIEAQASGGGGTLIGLVDTGVVASNPEIAGRVSGLSSCAATSFTCSNGFTDDNSHGTATAAIAAGQYNANDLMSGVAPSAAIVSEKALNASGSGYDTDVANGITKAANAGAKVISLSLTYTPSTAVISAIDYATSRGAVIVYAGGNSSQPLNGGANSTGLTTLALSHLIFVGSVNAANSLSSFSNTPGGGQAVAGTTRDSYASLWLMAQGENVVAPGIQYGAGSYAYWTGTSMAAPMVAGAVALLETTWPVLYRNGDAAAVLLQTATDLGAKGDDSTYGEGLLNLTKAFQPVGTLSVLTVRGAALPVSQLTSATLTSGALGSLPAIKSLLANYTAFDIFQRNFTVNLSGLVKTQSSTASVVAAALTPPVVSVTTVWRGGGRLTLAASDLSFAGDSGQPGGPSGDVQALTLADRTLAPQAAAFSLSLTTPRGDMAAMGRGVSSTASFASALWGQDAPAANQANQLGVSNALMGLAQGGYFGALGEPIGTRARLAVSWSASPEASAWSLETNPAPPRSSAVGVGLSLKLAPHWTAGITATRLDEQNGLLGTVFDGSGPLSLGQNHQSASVGVSMAVALGKGRSLLFDAVTARSSGASLGGGGLIDAVSALTARAYGVSFVQADAFRAGDRLTLSVRQPLRVIGGTAAIAVTTVDSQGYATTSPAQVSLRPSGAETDFAAGYTAPFAHGVLLNTGLSLRTDADNVRGAQDLLARVAISKAF